VPLIGIAESNRSTGSLLWRPTRRTAGFGLFALTIMVTPAHMYMLQRPELFNVSYCVLVAAAREERIQILVSLRLVQHGIGGNLNLRHHPRDFELEYGSVDALPVQPVRPRRKLVGHFLSRSQVKKSAWARSGEYPTEGNSGVTGAATGAAVVGIPGAGAIACAPETWGPAGDVASCGVTESNPAVRIYDRTL
jgi:hypothetical protein